GAGARPHRAGGDDRRGPPAPISHVHSDNRPAHAQRDRGLRPRRRCTLEFPRVCARLGQSSPRAGRTGDGAPPRRVRMDSLAMVLHWVEGAIGALDVVSEVPTMWRDGARIVDGAVTTPHATPPDHERIGLDL